ncbi:MAG: HAMP domain-containing protein [Chloroflexi bacterium]|nr:HAMP domain-containing protein [Chloroflexota bacterium]
MIHRIRRHLGWKLFLSYLVVILVGAVVVAAATALAVPSAFERHMAYMAQMVGGQMMGLDLATNFRQAVGEALTVGILVALVAALSLSLVMSRRIVLPVQEMMAASRRIADGRYDERVGVPGKVAVGDVDELGELALSFNQMAARLQQTEALRLQLLGNVAHELRTPLSSIKGYMEALIDGVLPAGAETFQRVQDEAERLQRLVDDLQELSRVEAGAYELSPRPTPVSQLVDTVVTRLGRQFEEKGVGLETDVPPGLTMNVDPERMGQVLLNLVGNALQYTPAGGQVRLRARREGSVLRLAVEDTGIGIAPEHLPHLFERFYRVDKSRSRVGGGSGIGLTIAKHLVEAHGGQIQAASEGLGRGSTFSVILPAA